jgi:hypothetical protein
MFRAIQCSKHVEDLNVIYYYRIKELCIKLLIETRLNYDSRSENHKITFLISYAELDGVQTP